MIRLIASLVMFVLLSAPVLAHDTDHHAITQDILEELQDLRDDFDSVYGPHLDDDNQGVTPGGGTETGRDDADCIAMWWEGNYLHYRNQCSYTVSVAYCDINPYWSWQESCGENRNVMQPYYTDIKHLCPGDENRWYKPGEINWAACKGFINVRDSRGEFTSDINGDYRCHNDPNGYDPCQ